MSVLIRPVRDHDIDTLLPLNNAAVPSVNALQRADFERFAATVPHFRVAVVNGMTAGMMIALGPGLDYDSPNYRWFERHYDGFLYVDRIVVDPSARSTGLGARLYDDLAAVAHGSGVPRLACEVNLRPANHRSLQFHERLGFKAVGTQDTEDGAKTVQLLVKDLESA